MAALDDETPPWSQTNDDEYDAKGSGSAGKQQGQSAASRKPGSGVASSLSSSSSASKTSSDATKTLSIKSIQPSNLPIPTRAPSGSYHRPVASASKSAATTSSTAAKPKPTATQTLNSDANKPPPKSSLHSPPTTPQKKVTSSAASSSSLSPPRKSLSTPTTSPSRSLSSLSSSKKYPKFPLLVDVESTSTYVLLRQLVKPSALDKSSQILRVSVQSVFFNKEQAFADALEFQVNEVEAVVGNGALVPTEPRAIALSEDNPKVPFESRLNKLHEWIEENKWFAGKGAETVLFIVEKTDFHEPRPVTSQGFASRFTSSAAQSEDLVSHSQLKDHSPVIIAIMEPTIDSITNLPVSLPDPLPTTYLSPSDFSGRYSATHITHPELRALLPDELTQAVLDLSVSLAGNKPIWGSCYLVDDMSCRFGGPFTVGSPELGVWNPLRTPEEQMEREKLKASFWNEDLNDQMVDEPKALKLTWKPASIMSSRLTETQRHQYAEGTARAEIRLFHGGWAVIGIEFPTECWVGQTVVWALLKKVK